MLGGRLSNQDEADVEDELLNLQNQVRDRERHLEFTIRLTDKFMRFLKLSCQTCRPTRCRLAHLETGKERYQRGARGNHKWIKQSHC